MMAMVGVAVVPTDKVRRCVDAGEVLAIDAKLGVTFAAERVDNLVVVRIQVVYLDVATEADVAEEPKTRVGGDLVVDLDDAFDLLVIGSHTAAHQAKRNGQSVEHVDRDAFYA